MSTFGSELQPSIFKNTFFLPPMEECSRLLNKRVELLLTFRIPKNIKWDNEEEYRPQVKEFNKLMAAFCEDYKRILTGHYYEKMDKVDLTHLNGLISLQENHRDHIYAIGHQPSWQLHYFEHDGFDTTEKNLLMWQWIAHRIYWVQMRMCNNEEAYPEADRYGGYVYQISYLKCMLSPTKANWILDLTTLLGLEIRTLMWEVSEIDFAFIGMTRYIKQFGYGNRDASIDRITTPCTQEVMSSSSYDDVDEHDTSCFMCMYAYGCKYNNKQETEPAVKTTCDHVFGKMCLSRWIQDHDTCPYCRHRVCHFADNLSKGARTIFYSIMDLQKARMQLDEQIDQYFLGDAKVCYGEPMMELLLKLRQIRMDTFAVERRLTQLKV
ncbi:hypothetical protein K491DRAFT_683489 [Lophiostoma macrostomum CBS 122681]|uniref:RING-type domain-containing protein n=1 Tax=Lophiostoma macrostomum CBS 122681 TaxID=1314788 RepID=A0A6A6SUH3_9PLEO|nr:hypothetical protein K491DRAFT_683489 [Lophiostoma macrostomum CBS 122681]